MRISYAFTKYLVLFVLLLATYLNASAIAMCVVKYSLNGTIVYQQEVSKGDSVYAPDLEAMNLPKLPEEYEYSFKKKFPFLVKSSTTVIIEEKFKSLGIFTLTLNVGSHPPFVLHYEHGKEVKINLPSTFQKPNYTLVWDTMIEVMPPYDVVMTASYVPIDYKISYSLEGGLNSASNPSKFNIESGTIHLEPATKGGFSFMGWYGDDGNKVEQIDGSMLKDINLTARWIANLEPSVIPEVSKYAVIGSAYLFNVNGKSITFANGVDGATLYNLLGMKVAVQKGRTMVVKQSGIYVLKIDGEVFKLRLQ